MTRTVACLFIVLSIAGCHNSDRSGSDSGGSSRGGAEYRIAVIPKGTGHQFWKSVHAGAQRAAEELGDVEVIWKGPQKENDTAGQIEVVKNFITKRVDGICLAPNHSEALVEAVQEANEENIPVVIFDSGLGKGAQLVSYIATDNFHGGELAADRMAQLLGGKGNVILLRYMAGSESTEQRERGFLTRLRMKHPDIHLLSSNQFAGPTAQTAMDKSIQLLIKHENKVDGIFAVCEPNCNGLLEAIKERGLAGKIKFVAFDPNESLIDGMKNDYVHGIVLQDPVNMGYLAVMKMVAHLKGGKLSQRVSTGEHVATRDNMQQEKYDRLLHPIQFGE